MAISIKASNHHNLVVDLKIDRFPGDCPSCRKHIEAKFFGASLHSDNFRPLYVAFICPVELCRAIFVATYRVSCAPASSSYTAQLTSTAPIVFSREVEFPKAVTQVSPTFLEIYNQALRAEDNGLLQVAGPGFRKAFEFLVKDYVLNKCMGDEENKATILKTFLGPCIEKYVDDARIKAVAKRAAWLGNDETHYYRKWDDKDLQDLKNLISMTVNWIDLVTTSEQYIEGMPEGGPKSS